MPDLTPNNPDNNSEDTNSSNDTNLRYELLTAYIDNELSDSESEKVKISIESDPDLYNRYIFEKLTKDNLKNRSKRIETPVYVYKNIGKEIDDYIKKSTLPKFNPQQVNTERYLKEEIRQKSNLRRNLLYSSFAFAFLIAAVFIFYPYLNINSNPDLKDNDLISVSRNVFDKLKSGKLNFQFKSSSAKELSDSMNKYVNFKVFIPEVKDAVLVGGDCNEINGQQVAHFVHRKGTVLIYTLEANKSEVLSNIDKVILCEEIKGIVKSGENWVPCNEDSKIATVIWFNDNIICASVSEMDHKDISKTLSNLK